MSTMVLVVDDDPDLRELITLTLTEAGYRVVGAADGPQAIDAYHRHQPELLILDIGLGAMDGLELCRRIRTLSDIPVVFLTSRAEEVDQLIGLAAGGDDYITKPFSPRILAARVGTVLRRHRAVPSNRTLFEVGLLRLDTEARTCEYDGHDLALTRIEFEILLTLIENPARVVTREALIDAVWGPWFGDQHLVESHISRLRKKMSSAGGPAVPQAIRGVGYKLGAKP